MPDEKQLDKIDIQSELKTLSPIEAKSVELKAQADAVEIIDKDSYSKAKKLRKELVSHRTSTKDLRLTFTRKLDNLKDQFIKKQDAVLEPSLAGEVIVKEKIAEWEKAEQERKEAEEKRMQEIVSKFDIQKLDRKTATYDDVKRERARIKMERGLLEPNDRNKVAVKNAIAANEEYFVELEDFIADRMEQERVAEEQRIEKERLDKERKELEEAQARVEKKTKEVESKITDEPKQTHTVVDTTTVSNDAITDTMQESIGKLAESAGRRLSNEIDVRVKAFLEKNGIEVDFHDIASTEKYLHENGYELRKDEQAVEPHEDEYLRKKHTYTLVKVIDTFEFESAMKIEKEDQ